MKLEINEIKERGTLEERIVFIVKEDCDIGKYLVFTTKMNSETKFSSSVRDAYWFPDKSVKKGDLIALYSRKGDNSFKVNTDNTTSHFFFRNLLNPILTTGNLALLIEASTWKLER